MEPFEKMIQWAAGKDVKMFGIGPQNIPGRGIGFVAMREIEAGETLLTIPTRTFRSLHNVPKAISRRLPKNISLHALLATHLSMDKSEECDIWNAVFPSLASFEASIPLMWPIELQKLLPSSAEDLLKKQQANFQRDWDTVSRVFSEITQEKYLHSWLVVNTRSFYYTTPKMKRYPHDDRLALLPVADLFNHAEIGCETAFSSQEYKIVTNRAYHTNEEIYVCYGTHSNDFLLAEYGFVLSQNRWDTVYLDEVVLPCFNTEQKNALRDAGYLGKYVLDSEKTICFRTQVALRILCCTNEQWQQFLCSENDDATSQRKANALLIQLLGNFVKTIQGKLENLKQLNVGQAHQKETLAFRWMQIEVMVSQTIEHFGS